MISESVVVEPSYAIYVLYIHHIFAQTDSKFVKCDFELKILKSVAHIHRLVITPKINLLLILMGKLEFSKLNFFFCLFMMRFQYFFSLFSMQVVKFVLYNQNE